MGLDRVRSEQGRWVHGWRRGGSSGSGERSVASTSPALLGIGLYRKPALRAVAFTSAALLGMGLSQKPALRELAVVFTSAAWNRSQNLALGEQEAGFAAAAAMEAEDMAAELVWLNAPLLL